MSWYHDTQQWNVDLTINKQPVTFVSRERSNATAADQSAQIALFTMKIAVSPWREKREFVEMRRRHVRLSEFQHGFFVLVA